MTKITVNQDKNEVMMQISRSDGKDVYLSLWLSYDEANLLEKKLQTVLDEMHKQLKLQKND